MKVRVQESNLKRIVTSTENKRKKEWQDERGRRWERET